MSQIKNLYTHLVENRRAELNAWLSRYKELSQDVKTIREALVGGGHIQDKATYTGTRFERQDDPWYAFAECLIFSRSNGISSRGQSVLSLTKFRDFIKDSEFVGALTGLIKDPSRDNVIKFTEAWENARQRYGANANPLLINRTVAACTNEVSTTVNNAAFESVYSWFVREGVVQKHADANASWYDKNLQVIAELHRIFEEELKSEKEDKLDEYLLNLFVWELFEYISNPFTLKKQVVKYGAPGTGKTFTAKQNAQLLFDIWAAKYESFEPGLEFEYCHEVVQFHPSYGYEDFIEGLRPVLTSDGQPQLKLQNGVFKEFCKRAGAWELQVYGLPATGPKLADEWPKLTLDKLKPYIAQHHLDSPSWRGIGEMEDSLKIVDIIPPFFFIIDEINRAELSRVLGELMFCMEYRGTQGKISTQYTALNTAETAMLQTTNGYKFFIPHNVYIIGTMNTIDRSVDSFDLALRRRFRWERTEPDLRILRYHLNQRDAEQAGKSQPWSSLADNLEKLNKLIRDTELLGPDYEIGHAYLMDLGYPARLDLSEVRKNLWEDSIKPLLEEYLRGSGRGKDLIPKFQTEFGVQ